MRRVGPVDAAAGTAWKEPLGWVERDEVGAGGVREGNLGWNVARVGRYPIQMQLTIGIQPSNGERFDYVAEPERAVGPNSKGAGKGDAAGEADFLGGAGARI